MVDPVYKNVKLNQCTTQLIVCVNVDFSWNILQTDSPSLLHEIKSEKWLSLENKWLHTVYLIFGAP